MKKISTLNVISQSNGTTDPKGSASNPYTLDEYEKKLNEGTWTGGFVEGIGYVIGEIVSYGNGTLSYVYSSRTDEFYTFYEGFGLFDFFEVYHNVIIHNGYLHLTTYVSKLLRRYNYIGGLVMVYQDGQCIRNIKLSIIGEYVGKPGDIPIGSADFSLKEYKGHVEIKVLVSAQFGDSYLGYGAINDQQTIYDQYR